jgi:hypothetical protein
LFSVPGDVRNAVSEADDALTRERERERERESLEANDAFGSASSWLPNASPL